MTGNLSEDWLVYVLLGVAGLSFIYVFVKSNPLRLLEKFVEINLGEPIRPK